MNFNSGSNLPNFLSGSNTFNTPFEPFVASSPSANILPNLNPNLATREYLNLPGADAVVENLFNVSGADNHDSGTDNVLPYAGTNLGIGSTISRSVTNNPGFDAELHYRLLNNPNNSSRPGGSSSGFPADHHDRHMSNPDISSQSGNSSYSFAVEKPSMNLDNLDDRSRESIDYFSSLPPSVTNSNRNVLNYERKFDQFLLSQSISDGKMFADHLADAAIGILNGNNSGGNQSSPSSSSANLPSSNKCDKSHGKKLKDQKSKLETDDESSNLSLTTKNLTNVNCLLTFPNLINGVVSPKSSIPTSNSVKKSNLLGL